MASSLTRRDDESDGAIVYMLRIEKADVQAHEKWWFPAVAYNLEQVQNLLRVKPPAARKVPGNSAISPDAE